MFEEVPTLDANGLVCGLQFDIGPIQSQPFKSSMPNLTEIVIIGGCGHVGLPLGIVFANCGLDVVLLDRDLAKIDIVNKGQMPFMEANALELLGRVVGKKLVATSDASRLGDSDAAIAVLGTPVDEHLNPTATDLYQSIDEVIARMPEKALLVLRSTVYPGVTKLVYERLQASGRKILLAFCPERIAEGKAMEEVRTLPQIISAFDPDSPGGRSHADAWGCSDRRERDLAAA